MTASDYLAILRRRWVGGALVLLAAVAVGLGYTVTATPVYRAQTVTFISGAGGDSANAYQGSQFTLQRVKSYPKLVTSPDVLQPVIDELKLNTTVVELQETVEADNPSDTVLLYISATSTQPTEAADIANAITNQFGATIEELERPSSDGRSPVKVTVTESASPPSSPITPRLGLNLFLAVLAGLGLAGALMLGRDALDTSVRSAQELSALTEAPVLTSVARVRGKAAPQIADRPDAPEAESYRTLRTNLSFVNVDDPPRLLVVVSPMSKEGRTTTACNLASTLATAGLKVCLVDTDLRKPSIGARLALHGEHGLTSVLTGSVSLEEALQPWSGGDVLTAGPATTHPSEMLSSKKMSAVLNTLVQSHDVVILDSPPILASSDAAILARYAHGALMLSRHDATRRKDISAALEALDAVGSRLIGSVVTFARGRGSETARPPHSHLPTPRQPLTPSTSASTHGE